MANPVSWGADCPISMPEPIQRQDSHVALGGGYVMTEFGLRHSLTTSDVEVLYQPVYAPIISEEAAS